MTGTKTAYLQILIAEKEPDIQAIYKMYLNHSGLQPTIISSGKECLDAVFASDGSFDMIILDTHLADMDGISVAKQILARIPDQRIIVTTTASDGREKELQKMGVEVLQKPFRFSSLLSLMKPRISRISKIGLTDHVLAVYQSQEEEIKEATELINSAIRNNETALLVIRRDIDTDGLKAKLKENGIEVDKLLATDALILTRNDDWYVPDKQMDKNRIIAQWHELVDRSTANGTRGLRAFCMMDCFFENGFIEEVVDYEHTLPVKFDIPFVPICAYRKQDIDKLSEDQLERLLVCHSHVWLDK